MDRKARSRYNVKQDARYCLKARAINKDILGYWYLTPERQKIVQESFHFN